MIADGSVDLPPWLPASACAVETACAAVQRSDDGVKLGGKRGCARGSHRCLMLSGQEAGTREGAFGDSLELSWISTAKLRHQFHRYLLGVYRDCRAGTLTQLQIFHVRPLPSSLSAATAWRPQYNFYLIHMYPHPP